MPKLKEVKWTSTQGGGTQEDRTTSGIVFQHIGDWQDCQCQIVPSYRMPGMYRVHATLHGQPGAFREARNLTADEAIRWCLETMDAITLTREERQRAHQALVDFEEQNGQKSFSVMNRMLRLEKAR